MPKPQSPTNDQCPSPNDQRRDGAFSWALVIGAWSFVGHWCLVIGHSYSYFLPILVARYVVSASSKGRLVFSSRWLTCSLAMPSLSAFWCRARFSRYVAR